MFGRLNIRKVFRKATINSIIWLYIFGATSSFAAPPPGSEQDGGKWNVRVGMARYPDSEDGKNVLVLIGSYCGWKTAYSKGGIIGVETRASGSGGEQSPGPAPEESLPREPEQDRYTYNYQNPQGSLKGKKKCTPLLREAVHNTLATILNIYMRTFRYRYAVMIEFGIRTHVISTFAPHPDHFSGVKKFEQTVEAIDLVEKGITEVDFLEELLAKVHKEWVKEKGTLDVYTHVHSSPTDFYINDTPFKIGTIWDYLNSKGVSLRRTNWYFDTCQAGRVQEFVKDETKPGHKLLTKLSDQWLVAVSSFQTEQSLWLNSKNRWGAGRVVSIYALAIQRAVASLKGNERVMDLFHRISDYANIVLQEHNLFHRRQNPGFTIYDTVFARSPVFQFFGGSEKDGPIVP